MMKKVNHIRLVGILMTLSWLLLMTFVIQWLVTRYGAEKEILRKDLEQQFTEAKGQVMDSTLIISLIEPLMNDPRQKVIVLNQIDSVVLHGERPQMQDSVIWRPGIPQNNVRVYEINISDSSIKRGVSNNQKGRFRSDSGNILLHSIRLIVNQSIDSSGNRSVFKQFLPSEIDTAMFRKIFVEKMNKEGFDFGVSLFSHSGKDSSIKPGSQILLRSRIFEDSIAAKIGRFSWYLVRRIIPHILFALVLLLLTGIAFVFTYRSLKKQVLLNDLRNDFISNISHELKTPVATVKVALESLRNFDMKKDPAVANDYLDMASQELNRLEQLISKVLNISVLDEDSNKMTLRLCDLKTLTERVIRSMTVRIESQQAELILDASQGDYSCYMDELFIEGVLVNLIDNSLKYAKGKPRISIRLSGNQNTITLEVSDQGPGISEKYIGKVFDKFFRIPTGDRHNVKGHGLGLSYAARVMDQHHGKISVRNNEDAGCTFTLTFPARQKSI